jgi:hypothetical protein
MEGARADWFQPPRLVTLADEGERRASWLELFFDLVFVVAITELSQYLVGNHSAAGFLRFAALFVPVYVAWQGYMAYATRFDTDDLPFRLAYFGAMLAIAAMAVLIGDVAHGVHSAAFAVAYVVLRSIMLALYARAWRAVPEARELIRFYGSGYAFGVALWLVSLAFDTPWRYVVWVVAQVIELSLPPLSTKLHRRIPTDPRHLPERWALFTLIGSASRSWPSRSRPPTRTGTSPLRPPRCWASQLSRPSGGSTSIARRTSSCTARRCRSSSIRTHTSRCWWAGGNELRSSPADGACR